MKKEILMIAFAMVFLVVGFGGASQNLTSDSFDVSVSVHATQEWAKVELNLGEIDFGWINLSASTADKRRSVYYEIRNQGNIDITVTPELADGTDRIFQRLKFSRLVSDALGLWQDIGNYSLDMNRTYTPGQWNSWQKLAIRLDMNNYLESGEQVPFDIVNHKNVVHFIVMPRNEN